MEFIEIFKSLIFDGRLTLGWTIWGIVILLVLFILFYATKVRISRSIKGFRLYRKIFSLAVYKGPFVLKLNAKASTKASEIYNAVSQQIETAIEKEVVPSFLKEESNA